jgi:hypothetical protein
LWQHMQPVMHHTLLRCTELDGSTRDHANPTQVTPWTNLQQFDRWSTVWHYWLAWVKRRGDLARLGQADQWVDIFLYMFALAPDLPPVWRMRWTCSCQMTQQLRWLCHRACCLCTHNQCAVARQLDTENQQVCHQLPLCIPIDCQVIILAYLWTGSSVTVQDGQVQVGDVD